MPADKRSLPDPFPVRAVIDSCVFPRTKQWLIPLTDLAAEGFLVPIWSPLIIAESNRVLTWLWVKRHGKEMTDAAWDKCSVASKFMFSELTRYFRVVEDCPPQATLWTDAPPDEWDAPLWTAAERAQASFIVTDNLADGPPKGANGIQEHAGIFLVDPDSFLSFVDQLVDRYVQAALQNARPPVILHSGEACADLYREILVDCGQNSARNSGDTHVRCN